MTLYCQAGDIARVTLPDGSIRDFRDTPITIDATREAYNTLGKDITIGISSINPRYVNGEIVGVEDYNNYYRFVAQGNILNAGRYAESTGFIPLPTSFPPYSNFVVLLDRNVQYLGDRWLYVPIQNTGGWSWGGNFYNFKIYDHSLNQWLEPSYNIKITGNSGNILFNETYSTNNYTVDCTQGCPPNTLDCGNGNCCSCDEIYNGISEIRNLLSRLR